MRTLDFIKSNIGNKVYINKGLGVDRELRKLISNKTELTLRRLSRGGMAIVADDDGKEYSIAPRYIREVGH